MIILEIAVTVIGIGVTLYSLAQILHIHSFHKGWQKGFKEHKEISDNQMKTLKDLYEKDFNELEKTYIEEIDKIADKIKKSNLTTNTKTNKTIN